MLSLIITCVNIDVGKIALSTIQFIIRSDYSFLGRQLYCPLPVSLEGTYGLRSVRLLVCLSHFSGSCDNFKSSSYFFMKLETWIDGNMDIMHVISFCYYVKNSDCYGNKQTRNTAENGGFLNPAITLKFFIFFHETCNMDRWQYGHYARHFILFLRQKLWLLWQPEKII